MKTLGKSRYWIALAALLAAVAPPAHADDAVALHDLIDAAAQRLLIADPVAANKWLTGGSITDPARVEQVLNGVGADAQSRGIAADYVQQIFRDQINATEGVEYSRFADWEFDVSPPPTTAPDLSSSRSEIDALNRKMVNQIALQWPVLHSPSCFNELAMAKTDVANARSFDELYRQALDTATKSYCPD